MITKEDLIEALEPKKVLAWLEQQEGSYDYVQSSSCAIAQYLNNIFTLSEDEIISVNPWSANVYSGNLQGKGYTKIVSTQLDPSVENAVKPTFQTEGEECYTGTFEGAARLLRDALDGSKTDPRLEEYLNIGGIDH